MKYKWKFCWMLSILHHILHTLLPATSLQLYALKFHSVFTVSLLFFVAFLNSVVLHFDSLFNNNNCLYFFPSLLIICSLHLSSCLIHNKFYQSRLRYFSAGQTDKHTHTHRHVITDVYTFMYSPQIISRWDDNSNTVGGQCLHYLLPSKFKNNCLYVCKGTFRRAVYWSIIGL